MAELEFFNRQVRLTATVTRPLIFATTAGSENVAYLEFTAL